MSTFSKIDSKLEQLTKRLNAELTKNRLGYPDALRTFEERRIDWVDDSVNKAIIIQPYFEVTGVNNNKWNFINVAWFDSKGHTAKLKWKKNLVTNEPFEIIENGIDALIKQSEENLSRITLQDLV